MAVETIIRRWGGHSMVAPLRRVLVYPPVAPNAGIDWRAFGYRNRIDHAAAEREHAAFRQLLVDAGVQVVAGDIPDPALQDAIFPFDPIVMTDAGAVLCRMGNPRRQREPDVVAQTLRDLGITVLGRITAPGTLEGGDCVWLDERTLAVGRGYRTDADGIKQLGALLAPQGIAVLTVELPHWHGPDECLHLLSLISPVDARLAVVHLPLLPVSFVELLRERGFDLIEVPDGEFASQGCNVLALAPRRCVLLRENRETARRLRAAGCEVLTYVGEEISHNRTGGPTCLTRPLLRETGDRGLARAWTEVQMSVG